MKRESLKAEKRDIVGKKVKKLRKEGLLPANMFGKGLVSQSLQLSLKDFEAVYDKVHETGLVDLEVGKDVHPILIQNVQIQPITHTPIHADFFKVNLKEKVRAAIPVVPVGEPKAVTERVGVLLQPLSEVEVEALPADLPEHLEVNVEPLAALDESLSIADIKVPNGVEILGEGTEMIFRIGAVVSEEAEELAEEEAQEAEESAEASASEAEAKAGEDESKAGEEEKPSE